MKEPGETIVTTTCNSHCGGTCLLEVHVKNGIITRVEADSGPDPQFRPCLKGRAHRQRIYSPDRIKHPLKRVGERGEGKFQPVSWDEALETTADQLKRVYEKFGPESIMLLGSAGDIAWVNSRDLIAKVLARAGGFSTTWGWKSHGAEMYAVLASYGTQFAGYSADDLLNSRLIIMWGWNPAETVFETNASWYLAQAKEAGIRIIAIDPRFTDSAATFAHQWIPIKPGTDTAVMLAMAYVMIASNAHDRAFLDKYTYGFDKFEAYVLGHEDGVAKTPAWAEAISGVPARTIADLAVEYATTKPAALLPGIGPGRSAFGEQYHRAAIVLSAMTANIGIHGGSAGHIARLSPAGSHSWWKLGPTVGQRLEGPQNPVDASPPRRYSLAAESYWPGWRSDSRVHVCNLADAIINGKNGGYPAEYRLLYVVNSNFVSQYPNINKIVKALQKLDFVVTQEQFMTGTAMYADIILPTNTFFERNDVTAGGATLFYGQMNKVIESIGESKSHFQIAAELARKMGIMDFSPLSEEQWREELSNGIRGIPDYEDFRKSGVYKVPPQPLISFENEIADPDHHPFPTSSGKIEIYSAELAKMNCPELPPIPKYVETWESLRDPLAEKYPLQLITTHFKRRAHSQFDNIPWLRELQQQAVLMHPIDAEVRSLRDGDIVRVFNQRGQVVVPARVTERIAPGVVDLPQGAWYRPDEFGADHGGCANVLTRDAASPGGGAIPCNTALVQIELASTR